MSSGHGDKWHGICSRYYIASSPHSAPLRVDEARPGVLCPVGALQYKRDMDILERLQQNASRTSKRLEHLWKDWELGLSSLEVEGSEGSYQCLQILKGRVQRGGCWSVQWQEKRQWAHTETQKIPSENQETLCHLGLPNIDTGLPSGVSILGEY